MLLASADDADIEDYIRRCATTAEPPYQLQDVDRLRAQLHNARRDGYALSEEDVVPGVATIAAPLRDRKGEIVAALSVGGASDVVIGGDHTRLARTIVEVAARIEVD